MGSNLWDFTPSTSEVDSSTLLVEDLWNGFNITAGLCSSFVNRCATRPSLQDQASTTWEYLERFKKRLLAASSRAYHRHVRVGIASLEEAKDLTLREIYRWLEWPGDVLDDWEQELLRGRPASMLPDRLTQWFDRAGFPRASEGQFFDLPKIIREIISDLRLGLDEAEKEAQRELQQELQVRKPVREAVAFEQRGSSSGEGRMLQGS